MSFWEGLTRGMKDADARNQRDAAADERKEAVEYRRSRDALSDERYAEAQTLAARSAAQANARAEAALAENTRRFDLGQERLAGQDDRAEAAEARAASTFEMGLVQQYANLGFGGTAAARSTGGGGSSRTPSAQDMNDSVIKLTAELGGPEGLSSMSKEHQTFYQTFLDVPSAAHSLRGFIIAQRNKDNDITMENLPDLINLAGTVEARGQEDYEAFAARVAGGADLSDPKVFMEGYDAWQNFSPASVVWDQLNVAQPALNDQDAYGEFISMLPMAAVRATRSLPQGDPKIRAIIEASQKLESTNEAVRFDGAMDLAELGVGQEIAGAMGANKFMTEFRFPEPVTSAAQPAMADPVTPVSEPSASSMSFDTIEELNAWADDNAEQAANLREAIVDGQVLTRGGNTPEVTPTLGTDTKASGDSAELISIVNNPNIGQDVKDMAMKEYSDTYGFTATREAVMESMRPGVSQAITDDKVLEGEKADTLASLDAIARAQPAGFKDLSENVSALENEASVKAAIEREATPTLGPMSPPDVGPLSNDQKIERWRRNATKVTHEEYKAMSNSELREAGLPSQGLAQLATFGILSSKYFKDPTVGNPTEGTDTSMQDSQDLVDMMESVWVDPRDLQEAVRVFEEKYGVGSAEAAVEMIKKSQ